MRNKNKKTMEARCYVMMKGNDDYCGDDIYRLVCDIINDDFDVELTPEIVKKIRSINRARQRILKNYPFLDKRESMKDLQGNDTIYYREEMNI